ncbi:3-hydroxyacyl-CoA dehydrogenase NAD-binding domain-containing protein [Lysobacter enzymogenes]|uniref:3-hydroxyacyl-CoA dehydrogenase NAD-binding domain-containing protein n=1 Tax=Lysobacter enzymogenes TaxID=69 RepID=UPI00099D5C5B|nr:3-hydroxyacyl-CoA dehydrogenase NAD-binding domain-containing protein [Lysobacter enzymogenes]UZW62177.1 3-hydroxyacyl-CoA dehydrogenase NAD-binding domain-containing protein [Lysobacter enzymogenes]
MNNDLGVKSIGIVGCGVIGMSWAAYFLAKGFSVRAADPNATAEARTRAYVDKAWPLLEQMGLEPGADRARLFFSTDLATALDGVDFVQENGPERLDLKHQLFRDIADAIRADVIVASSSSGIPVSDFQAAAAHPERIVLGHPFNPPHVIPLVEVAGGNLTSSENVAKAMRFYAQIGKKPIRMKREMKGHIANRIQAAVLREVLYLLEQDVASVEDLDIAIAHGPGLRWAILGQFVNADLGGGEGGIRHMMEHLGPAMESWWADLGRIEHITPQGIDLMGDGVAEILARGGVADIASARDEVLLKILRAKAAVRLPY